MPCHLASLQKDQDALIEQSNNLLMQWVIM